MWVLCECECVCVYVSVCERERVMPFDLMTDYKLSNTLKHLTSLSSVLSPHTPLV